MTPEQKLAAIEEIVTRHCHVATLWGVKPNEEIREIRVVLDITGSHRPADAGTVNDWTFAGGGKVVYTGKDLNGTPTALIRTRIGQAIVITTHQASALLEILPAVIALGEREEEDR